MRETNEAIMADRRSERESRRESDRPNHSSGRYRPEEVEVTVSKGEVTVSGVVENKGIKRRVEDLVEDISGVKHVENLLKLRFPGGQIVNIRNSGEK